MGIRLLVVDDNPHVSSQGRVYPVNATFQHFVAALLDLPGSPVASVTSAVPVRPASARPGTLPLDPRIRVVGTEPFDGIAGYLRAAPRLVSANRRILRRAMDDADLLWLKVPASNAALAAALAARAGVPRFVWVAGSARDVAGARYRGLRGLGAGLVGVAYDGVGRLAAVGGDRVVTGADLVDGDGVVSSLVAAAEIRDSAGRPWPPTGERARLVWAGRLVDGKGLEGLLDAVGADATTELEVLGDGPARDRLQAYAVSVGAGDRVTWVGHVADRAAYMDRLAAGDAFVFPSAAEGFPKVILDAFAAGLPVLATPSGAVGGLVSSGLIGPITGADGAAVTAAWQGLRAADPRIVADRLRRAQAFVLRHTAAAEASRLVARWRHRWPTLALGPDPDHAD